MAKKKKWQNLFRFIQKVTNLRIVFGEDIRCMGWRWGGDGDGGGGWGVVFHILKLLCCYQPDPNKAKICTQSLSQHNKKRNLCVYERTVSNLQLESKTETKKVILHFSPKGIYQIHLFCTVIRFLWVSAKFGTCTVVSVNGTHVEDKMRRFKGECEHFSILSSTCVPCKLTTVQVPNLALTHTRRITVCIASMEFSLLTNSQCTTCIYKICKQHPTQCSDAHFFYNRRSLGAIFCQM